ncbi:MAG TPA: hypothetical protein VH988_03030 [Thermoanaerobaculia bacterium]|jgi:hypothetical protein|nr:hypothetical protein [Thermoanaerobaculia bacterium]
MPKSSACCLSFFLLLPGLVVSASAFAAPRPAASKPAGETVDVEIKIVPFYAVDADGKPVWDLKSDEVELRIGGKPMFVDTFDGPAAPGGAERSGSNGLRPASRNVIFFIDSAFTSPSAFRNSIQVAQKLVGEVPEGDRLSLVAHSVGKGLEKKLGPVPADRKGKARFLDALAALIPEIRRLNTNPVDDLPPVMQVTHNGQNGVREDLPTSQFMGQIDSMQEFGRSEYMSLARGLADSLDFTAAELRHQRGPKLLLVFWQGLDSDLYFTGDIGFKPGSTASTSYGGQRTSGLLLHFAGPLQALAESGAMTVFVNASAPGGIGNDAEGVMRHIAQTAGAAYASGADPQQVEGKIAATTAAYYEAGFYLKGEPTTVRESVEVVVKRPGVHAWAPSALKVRETYESLTAYEKQLLILGLVANGPEAQRGPVKLSYQELGGKIESRPEAKGGRRLRYAAAWPAGLQTKDLDLYNVALVPPAKGEKAPKIVQFDHLDGAHPGAVPMEIDLPKESKLIWGIVAVEPSTGQTWVRRLQLAGDKQAR